MNKLGYIEGCKLIHDTFIKGNKELESDLAPIFVPDWNAVMAIFNEIKYSKRKNYIPVGEISSELYHAFKELERAILYISIDKSLEAIIKLAQILNK